MKSTAPVFMADTERPTEGKAVIRMTEMAGLISRMRLSRSIPFMPGMWMSLMTRS
ncbi:MAG: hypothetical protein A4E67_00193 [Syntrophaceae bacterium PtaB.Bin038]|nr:MAG: hypothetical protein A4E67_00193 [Syntrophaceae bacterium PtaB.Bin038]